MSYLCGGCGAEVPYQRCKCTPPTNPEPSVEPGDFLRTVTKRQAFELVRLGTWDIETFNRWCWGLQGISPEPGEQYESGWVIEGAWSPTDQPEYWVGSSTWSTDPYKALRFANQQSAQQAADLMCDGLNVRICEHEWACSTLTKETQHGD